MKYKLICIDLDGTLLNRDKVISERNRKVLKAVSDRGVFVIPATGRVLFNALNVLYPFNLYDYIVTSNGALIKDLRNDQILRQINIGEHQILKILDFSGKNRLDPVFYTNEKIYISGKSNLAMYKLYGIKSDAIPAERMNFVRNFNEWSSVLKKEKAPFGKCIFYGMSDRKSHRMREALNSDHSLEMVFMGKRSLEITGAGATKGGAAAFLSEKLCISPQEIIAFGDSENDYSMIKYAGTGVAMANAAPLLKKEADFIIGNNNGDGIARFLENHVLNEEN